MFIENKEAHEEEEQLGDELNLPPKPKAKRVERIRNAGGVNPDSARIIGNQDNMERGSQLAGYALFPPIVIGTLVLDLQGRTSSLASSPKKSSTSGSSDNSTSCY